MTQIINLAVSGMTCDHCVRSVTEAIKSVEGVADAKVSLADNAATLEGEGVDIQAVIDAIAEEGYEAVPA